MIATEGRFFRLPVLLSGIMAMCLLPCAAVFAQDDDRDYRSDESGRVKIEDNDRRAGSNDPISFGPDSEDERQASQNTGPVRLARFAFVSGNVTWRTDSGGEWSKATVNLPIREGAQVWVTDGRADLQFDDGSELRLGNGALATLKVLYSDKEGEFTQIALNDGLATLHSRHDDAVFQVDTPAASVKSRGVSQIRFGVEDGSEISVQRGEATIEGPQGKTSLHAGDYLFLQDSSDPFKIRTAPHADDWDRWNDDRNRILERGGNRHVPSNIGLVSGELDDYGTWRTDPAYGSVWCPRNVSSGWRPYYDGRWTWCDPFGWTWVSNEPWGWAPYHYGSWVHAAYGWGWCPGPIYQYWSPAVVHFSVYDGGVAWAPLCPNDIRYPSALSFGYWGRNWAFSFSIGSAGVYYPYGGYCVGRPWNNQFVNFYGYGNHGFNNHGLGNSGFNDRNFDRGGGSPSFNRFSRTNEFAAANSQFVPFHARRGNGASFARLDSFGGQGRYEALGTNSANYFSRGRYAAAPGAGQAPVAGPPRVSPTAIGRTPTRSFLSGVQPPQSALQRNLYHALTPLMGRQDPRATIGGAGRTGSTTSPVLPGARSRTPTDAARSGVIGGNAGARSSALAPGSRARSPLDGSRFGADPGRTGAADSSAIPGARARTPVDGTRAGVGAGTVTREPKHPSVSPGSGANGSHRSFDNGATIQTDPRAGIRPGDGRFSAAEAARSARSSLGIGGRAYAPNGAGSPSGAVPGDRYGAGRTPRFGGSSGTTTDHGGPIGTGGRAPDSSYRSGTPRSYGGTSAGSSGAYSVPGTGSPRSYGGSDTGPYRNYGDNDARPTPRTGGYSSGRSSGYGGDYSGPRSGSTGDTTAPRSGYGGYGSGRSGGYGGDYSTPRSSSGSGNSSGRSGGSYGGAPAGRSSGGSTGGSSGSYGGDRSSGAPSGGSTGGRSSGDGSGGGYNSGRSRR